MKLNPWRVLCSNFLSVSDLIGPCSFFFTHLLHSFIGLYPMYIPICRSHKINTPVNKYWDFMIKTNQKNSQKVILSGATDTTVHFLFIFHYSRLKVNTVCYRYCLIMSVREYPQKRWNSKLYGHLWLQQLNRRLKKEIVDHLKPDMSL